MLAIPISGGRFINVGAVYTEPDKEGTVFGGDVVQIRPQQEMLDQFEGWEEEVLQVLRVRRISIKP